jgi:hypothetical protein
MYMRHTVMWPAPLYNIFPHYLIKGTILGKKIPEHKICVSIFSTTYVWNISHSKNKWARYDKRCILVFMSSTFYSCPILMELNFLDRFSKKILKYEIS